MPDECRFHFAASRLGQTLLTLWLGHTPVFRHVTIFVIFTHVIIDTGFVIGLETLIGCADFTGIAANLGAVCLCASDVTFFALLVANLVFADVSFVTAIAAAGISAIAAVFTASAETARVAAIRATSGFAVDTNRRRHADFLFRALFVHLAIAVTTWSLGEAVSFVAKFCIQTGCPVTVALRSASQVGAHFVGVALHSKAISFFVTTVAVTNFIVEAGQSAAVSGIVASIIETGLIVFAGVSAAVSGDFLAFAIHAGFILFAGDSAAVSLVLAGIIPADLVFAALLAAAQFGFVAAWLVGLAGSVHASLVACTRSLARIHVLRVILALLRVVLFTSGRRWRYR